MRKFILRFGLLSGVIIAAITAISFSIYSDEDIMTAGQVIGYAMMTLALSIGMVFAMLKYRREKPATFGQSVLLCLGIGSLASLIYIVGWALTYNFIVPDFMDTMLTFQKKQLDLGKIKPSEFEMVQKWAEYYKNPFAFFLITLIEIFPVAIILSVVIPLVFKLTKSKTPAVS